MREILFRGKRIDNGEWAEGVPHFMSATSAVMIKSVLFAPMHEQPYHYIATGFLIDVTSAGQYTGLTDKNGKRIFEGDIVYDKYSNKAYVSMEKGCWVLMYKEDWDFLETNASTCGVIGNIHDNPEMLKGDKHDTNT